MVASAICRVVMGRVGSSYTKPHVRQGRMKYSLLDSAAKPANWLAPKDVQLIILDV